MGFVFGDRVVVIAHEPDDDWRQRGEIPLGTEGIVRGTSGTAENPESRTDEQTYWVEFELPFEEHNWCRKLSDTKISACMFESMLELADDPDFVTPDPKDLSDLFDFVVDDYLKRLEETE